MPLDPPAQLDACRHDWIGLGGDWERWLRTPLTQEDRDAVEGWRRRGLPLVVARRQPADAADDLRLGLSLPDKRRIGVHVASSAAVTHAGPPALAAVLASAPAVWWPLLASVLLAADALGVPVHVFGSLAWQHWSGQEYVRPGSDIDLLFAPRRWTEVERLLAELQSLCGPGAVPRLDGEVLLPDGGAVAWRELAARPARLMVKGPRDVALRDHAAVAALFSEFPA
jgi:phosphoribosyl-dephospho-CoA transferase